MTSPSPPSTMVCDPTTSGGRNGLRMGAGAGLRAPSPDLDGRKARHPHPGASPRGALWPAYGCACAIGAGAVVTARHADDQAGNDSLPPDPGFRRHGSFRRARRATWRADFAAAPARLTEIGAGRRLPRRGPPILQRPLQRRSSLRPGAIRKLLPALDELGLDTDALLRLGARAARADAALDACARDLRARAVREAGPQLASFDADPLREAPIELFQRVVAAEIARLAPDAQIRLDRLERAVARLAEALQSRKALRLTLCGLILGFDG